MKKHFLVVVICSYFTFLLPAVSDSLLLQNAITSKQTSLALSFINRGFAERSSQNPDPFYILDVPNPDDDSSRRLELTPLALAVFCDELDVVTALLKRGYSPCDFVNAYQLNKDGSINKANIISILEIAITYKKNYLPILYSYLDPAKEAQHSRKRKSYDDYDKCR